MKRLILAAALLVGCSQDGDGVRHIASRATAPTPERACVHECGAWYRYATRMERHRHRDQLRNCENDPDPAGCIFWENEYHASLMREWAINYEFCVSSCEPFPEW